MKGFARGVLAGVIMVSAAIAVILLLTDED